MHELVFLFSIFAIEFFYEHIFHAVTKNVQSFDKDPYLTNQQQKLCEGYEIKRIIII